MEPRPSESSVSGIRCGIVLSGGNGTRIKDFVSQLRDSDLPKQYINFIGKRSMLEHTFQRAEKYIPAQRLYTVVASEHLHFAEVRRQIASRPRQTIVIQPENKTPALGSCFPSCIFANSFGIVERDGSRMVLLGLEPHEPDPEYGYIVAGEMINAGLGARRVELFVEKPAMEAARKMIRTGTSWYCRSEAPRGAIGAQATGCRTRYRSSREINPS